MKAISLILTLLFAILATATSTTMAGEAVNGERDALMALYDSTNGPSWKNNTGWGVGDPCDMAWYGVNCESGHVQRLRLTYNQLSGSIPAEFGNLSNLRYLYLYNNQLSGPIPAELGNLSSLGYLDLRSNQLSGSIPAELGNLSSLKVLTLSSNQLSGPIPAELGNLSSLGRLSLRSNQLSGSIPAELGNLSKLGYLDLNSNQLSGPIPAELSNLTNMRHLRLSNNPSLVCWQSEAALLWAQSLNPPTRYSDYFGPEVVCKFVYLPVAMSASG